MLTREQIIEIDTYCAEHKVTQDARLVELGIPRHQYYRWKKKYREADEAGQTPEGGSFMQIAPGGAFVSPLMPPAKTSGKVKSNTSAPAESFLTIELRTVSGSAMRIQGSMTAEHLRAILSGNV
jgi:hypothetical protein